MATALQASGRSNSLLDLPFYIGFIMRLIELFETAKLIELKKSTMKSYVKKAGQDNADRASSDSFISGKNGDKYNKAPDDTRKDRNRDKGIGSALDKISKDKVDEAKAKKKVEKSTPRNFVAKNVQTSGAGSHSDRKHNRKEKHKKSPERSDSDFL